MPQPAYTRTGILVLLREFGPMTAAEISERMGLSRRSIDGCLIGSRAKYGTEHFRIVGYEPTRGSGGREKPIYGPGPGEDAKRPTYGLQAHREADARYRRMTRGLIRLRTNARRRGQANPYQPLTW